MSQTELAKAIGSEQSYVSKIERGVHTPSAVLLQRIARALNVDANDILIETPPQAVAS